MKKKSKIAVIGAGSWGTALAGLLANKSDVVLWAHKQEHIENLSRDRENKKFLPGFLFPDNLNLTANLTTAVQGCDTVCMVVPSHGYRSVFEKILPHLSPGCAVISAVKGIENESLMTMSQVMQDVAAKTGNNDFHAAVLSGPSFAAEVARALPTAVTIGCEDLTIVKKLQDQFVTDMFRVYASSDVVGLEISAALKNIIAIGSGICDGLGYGLNTRAALITRGLAEITRLGVKMGASPVTFSGLSGLGDLVLTCTGDLSRNRTVGLELGKGKKLPEILESMQMVAEGVKTTKSAYNLAKKLKIEMPILEQVYQIIYNDKDCSVAVKELLTRDLTFE